MQYKINALDFYNCTQKVGITRILSILILKIVSFIFTRSINQKAKLVARNPTNILLVKSRMKQA